jgi:hypothetical protein
MSARYLFLALLGVLAMVGASRVQIAVLPGWAVPLPVLIVAAEALAVAGLAAWCAVLLLGSRAAALPHVAVAITWRELPS